MKNKELKNKERYKPLFLPALRGSVGVFLIGAAEVILGIVESFKWN